nr:hypothetical protein [Gemmatimonadaceae bacterium]
MLTRLIASRPASMGGRPVRVATSASVVLHVMMIGGWIALARSGALEPSAPDLTRVEYVGIADVERPAPVAEEAPPPVAETPTTKAPKYLPPTAMEVQGPVLDPAATAGFQELAPPKEVSGIPPEVAAQAVRAEDFGGRGMVGGSGSGARPEGPVATSASELVPGAPPGDGAPGAATVFDGGAVEVPPELVNDERVAMALRDLYPQSMREMGITADVIAEFTVDAKG